MPPPLPDVPSVQAQRFLETHLYIAVFLCVLPRDRGVVLTGRDGAMRSQPASLKGSIRPIKGLSN